MPELIFKEQSYQIIGLCMEVHRELGHGFKEVVYKDALEYELKQAGIHYHREKQFVIPYKDIILQRKYCADFIVYDEIVIEAKATSMISNEFVTQTINYLKASSLKLGIIANFGQPSFTWKRVVF
jgi:GxxExxY protein